MNWNIAGRFCVLIIGGLIWGYAALKHTPELDGVKNAWVYRASYFMLLLRGWVFLWFDICGLFPL